MTDASAPGTDESPRASEWVAGARALAPMLVAVVPFGLVVGASAVAKGVGALGASGFSLIVFAGSSQLAAIDVVGDGGSAAVAIVAAITINMRMLLYSASLAPYTASWTLARRLGAAYLLTDQSYAIAISRWTGTARRPPRLAFYLGAGLTLWVVWQISTVAGALLGSTVPEDVPLDFAVPLVFLVLLVPTIVNRPSAAAAVVGGVAAVVAAQAGAGSLAVVVGAVSGIAAGAAVEVLVRRPPSPEVTP